MIAMEDKSDREETLRVLVDLAMTDDAASCFDGRRAMRLLRSQTTREELESLGVDRVTINQIWPDGGAEDE